MFIIIIIIIIMFMYEHLNEPYVETEVRGAFKF
jgi:hypothetical protein